MPRKTWRKCSRCGHTMFTSMVYHRTRKNGIHFSCGTMRVMDRDSDFKPPAEAGG